MTQNQRELEHMFKIMLDNISLSNMFKWFQRNNMEIETGYSKINLMKST